MANSDVTPNRQTQQRQQQQQGDTDRPTDKTDTQIKYCAPSAKASREVVLEKVIFVIHNYSKQSHFTSLFKDLEHKIHIHSTLQRNRWIPRRDISKKTIADFSENENGGK